MKAFLPVFVMMSMSATAFGMPTYLACLENANMGRNGTEKDTAKIQCLNSYGSEMTRVQCESVAHTMYYSKNSELAKEVCLARTELSKVQMDLRIDFVATECTSNLETATSREGQVQRACVGYLDQDQTKSALMIQVVGETVARVYAVALEKPVAMMSGLIQTFMGQRMTAMGSTLDDANAISGRLVSLQTPGRSVRHLWINGQDGLRLDGKTLRAQ